MDKNAQYHVLAKVLSQAFDRASEGKGKVRHANLDIPFEQQDIVTEQYDLGIAGNVYQIRKKAKEAMRLDSQKAINEFLDIIVYAAAVVVYLSLTEESNEQQNARS